MGAALALLTAMALLVAGYVAVTGSVIGSSFAALWSGKVAWILAAVATAAWAYKVLVYKGLLG